MVCDGKNEKIWYVMGNVSLLSWLSKILHLLRIQNT